MKSDLSGPGKHTVSAQQMLTCMVGQVLPEDLNRLLIIVVVLSMALTPALAELGKYFAERTAGMPLPGVGESGNNTS